MEQLDKGIALANAGKIILAQPYETSTVEYRLFNLASYLLLKGNASFIAMGGGGCKWWPECTHSHSSIAFQLPRKPDTTPAARRRDSDRIAG